jgi:hypothetical protein
MDAYGWLNSRIGQRILSPLEAILPDLTKREEPILTGLAAVKVMLRLVTSCDKTSSSSGGRVAVPRRVAHAIFADRNVGLPGGSLNFAPVENSATGKVVVPRVDCRFEKMSNITFEFKNGKMENFQASQGKKCFDDLMATSDGPKDMSFTSNTSAPPCDRASVEAMKAAKSDMNRSPARR